MKKHEVYEGIVERVTFPNKGIVAVEGEDTTCVVKNVLPGQRVRFRVTKKRNGSAEGNLIEILTPSPDECGALCPHFDKCGGCSYQTLPYEKQLALKDWQVHELLKPVLRSTNDVFRPILASPVQFAYRNKMEFSFGDEVKGGELQLGLHKRGSFYDIVTVKNCKIIDRDMQMILSETLSYFREKDITYFHKQTHEGYLRHLLIRRGVKMNEILVDLVTSSQTPPDTICMEKGLLQDYTDRILALPLTNRLVGILHTVNDAVSDTIINEHTDILYGTDFFFDEVLECKFRITPFSFFQTNTYSAEVLYDTVRKFVTESADGLAESVVYDLYSGTGTIAQLVAPVAKKVIGVEIVPEAVEAAKENARQNGLTNCDFIAGDVLKVLDDIDEKPDYIILDPPRDGIHPKALSKIIAYGVKNIVYISCKPSSLARDLVALQAGGYEVQIIQPLDQFPGTVHVETVVLITRKDK